MPYFKEIKIYRPIINSVKNLATRGISLSRQNHVVLSWPEDPDCKLECRLGWENEKVTHIVILPNPQKG